MVCPISTFNQVLTIEVYRKKVSIRLVLFGCEACRGLVLTGSTKYPATKSANERNSEQRSSLLLFYMLNWHPFFKIYILFDFIHDSIVSRLRAKAQKAQIMFIARADRAVCPVSVLL